MISGITRINLGQLNFVTKKESNIIAISHETPSIIVRLLIFTKIL
jgi:hypothetical protein